MLDQVALTWRATLGTRYVTSPLYCVRYGSTTRQYGFATDNGDVVLLPAADPAMELFDNPVAPAPSSGKAVRSAQASWRRRPVLVPPCTVMPLRSRATTFTSTPCQFSVCLARTFADCASSLTWPTLPGTRLYSPLTTWPLAFPSRGSVGATMLKGV